LSPFPAIYSCLSCKSGITFPIRHQ
jgi:hypothetical protein